MSDSHVEELLKLMREINEKLDKILYTEMKSTKEELEAIRFYVKNISESK